jgi:pimeloyl-ACP methyl ester carboxylesterase
MPVRIVSSVVVVGLLTITLGGREAVHPRQPQSATAAQQAATGLAAASDQWFRADGVTLRYRDAGTGAPVVLIHGYSTSLETMIPLAEALGPSHRTIAMDVRGFGQSSKFADASRFGPAMVDDVVRLMDHLKVDRAHLIGHSMGALIAAQVGAKYPDRVRSATLIAAPFYPDKATFTRESGRWVTELENGRGLTRFIQWLFPGMDDQTAAGFNTKIMAANELPSLIGVMRSLPELALRGIDGDAALLVTVGTRDPLQPESVAFAKASAGARLLIVTDADHMSIASSPEVHQAMRTLIAGAR